MKILKFIIIFTGFSFLAGIWMNFLLPQGITTGTICGKVLDIDGNPIMGATVTLTSASGLTVRTLTRADGRFCSSALPLGKYDLTVSMEGLQTVVRKNIYPKIAETTELTFNMMISVNEVAFLGEPIPPKIIELKNNHGINPYKKKIVHKKDSNFYYREKKFFAKYGVAKVGTTEKDLKDITEFPYKPEEYHAGGLDIIPRGVYVIKLDQKGGKLLFIRVIK